MSVGRGGGPEGADAPGGHGGPTPFDDHPGPVVSDDTCGDEWVRTPLYAQMTPTATELPAMLTAGGTHVGGRLDAVYAGPDGTWEVVDGVARGQQVQRGDVGTKASPPRAVLVHSASWKNV